MAACFVFLFMFITALFTIADEAASQETIKLNFSTMFPKGHLHSVLNQMYCDEIEKRTNGKVKITLFPGGTLTSAVKMYEGVVKGLSDLGMSCPLYVAGR
ncbi:MAG: TRAP-type C4-dicarboxylate transport system, periplasmic component, partial [Deltaproteobacteria bacterium]|nr:TRAP-type C4-dicarboxylate transport system, periplasmic component [Deltaproteobacteria bacterium]